MRTRFSPAHMATMMGLLLAGHGLQAQGRTARVSPPQVSAALEAEASATGPGGIWMREMRRNYPDAWEALKVRLAAGAAHGLNNAQVWAVSADFQVRFFAAKRPSLARSSPGALRDVLERTTILLRSLESSYPGECQQFTSVGSLAPGSQAALSTTVQYQLSYLQAAVIRAAKVGDLSSQSPAAPLNRSDLRAIALSFMKAGGAREGFEAALMNRNAGLSGAEICDATIRLNEAFLRAPDAVLARRPAAPPR